MEKGKLEKLAAMLDRAGWEIDSLNVERYRHGDLEGAGELSGFVSPRIHGKPEASHESDNQ